MIRKINILLLLVIWSMVFGCGPKEAPQKKMTSINGEVVYIFNKDGSVKALFKEKFNNYNFAILVLRDTILLGKEFKSSIYVTNPNHKIEITSPIQQIILSDTAKSNEFKSYQFTLGTVGLVMDRKIVLVGKEGGME